MAKLHEMSDDSRRAREQMARDAKADRDELQWSIQAMQSTAAVNNMGAAQGTDGLRPIPEAQAANMGQPPGPGNVTSLKQL